MAKCGFGGRGWGIPLQLSTLMATDRKRIEQTKSNNRTKTIKSERKDQIRTRQPSPIDCLLCYSDQVLQVTSFCLHLLLLLLLLLLFRRRLRSGRKGRRGEGKAKDLSLTVEKKQREGCREKAVAVVEIRSSPIDGVRWGPRVRRFTRVNQNLVGQVSLGHMITSHDPRVPVLLQHIHFFSFLSLSFSLFIFGRIFPNTLFFLLFWSNFEVQVLKRWRRRREKKILGDKNIRKGEGV